MYAICSLLERFTLFAFYFESEPCADCRAVDDSFIVLQAIIWYGTLARGTVSILFKNASLLQLLGAHQKNPFVFQVVWKGTKAVGVGIATTSELDDQGLYESYVVARYYPPGNYEGEFESNVGKKL